MKVRCFLLVMVVYVVALLALHLLHNRFLNVDVVLYSAIQDAVAALVVTGCWVLMGERFKDFSGLERFQTLFICLLGGYIFAISVPTVIDRSLSMYILEKLDQRGGAIRESAFERVFTQEYVKEHRLVDVRLTEQMQSGTIEIQDGCVKLTPRGQRMAAFTRFYRQNLLPKHRLLMGRYSDDLTDPFRHSQAIDDANYRCQ